MMRLPGIFLVFSLLAAGAPAAPGNTTEPAAQKAAGLRLCPDFGRTEDGMPERLVFAEAVDRERCFFVISKAAPVRLSVYEADGADTVLLAVYPACVARNFGQKQRKGDNRTPESWPGNPFHITQIQPSSSWHHDFGDGRGSIPAYGDWFLRLATPGFSGIGIHGSTGNRESLLAGRGSEGCIRLLDEDIIHLKEHYARVGTPVIILPEEKGALPFEPAAYGIRKREGAMLVPYIKAKAGNATVEPGRPRR